MCCLPVASAFWFLGTITYRSGPAAAFGKAGRCSCV
jgi:hypothetical protein